MPTGSVGRRILPTPKPLVKPDLRTGGAAEHRAFEGHRRTIVDARIPAIPRLIPAIRTARFLAARRQGEWNTPP